MLALARDASFNGTRYVAGASLAERYFAIHNIWVYLTTVVLYVERHLRVSGSAASCPTFRRELPCGGARREGRRTRCGPL